MQKRKNSNSDCLSLYYFTLSLWQCLTRPVTVKYENKEKKNADKAWGMWHVNVCPFSSKRSRPYIILYIPIWSNRYSPILAVQICHYNDPQNSQNTPNWLLLPRAQSFTHWCVWWTCCIRHVCISWFINSCGSKF